MAAVEVEAWVEWVALEEEWGWVWEGLEVALKMMICQVVVAIPQEVVWEEEVVEDMEVVVGDMEEVGQEGQ